MFLKQPHNDRSASKEPLITRVIMPMSSRILIADDSLIIRRSLKSELLNAGFDVCGEAEDGCAAVEKAVELKPDLVIIDLIMPKLNGLAASREISRRLPGVPIVMHSVHVLPEHEFSSESQLGSLRTCLSRVG